MTQISPSSSVSFLQVGHGFPKDPKPFFIAPRAFPVIENRPGATKDYGQLKSHLSEGNLLSVLSDFHLLLFILKSEIFDLETDFPLLLEAVRTQNQARLEAVVNTPSWKTFIMVRKHSEPHLLLFAFFILSLSLSFLCLGDQRGCAIPFYFFTPSSFFSCFS